jgi:hypothetical protein
MLPWSMRYYFVGLIYLILVGGCGSAPQKHPDVHHPPLYPGYYDMTEAVDPIVRQITYSVSSPCKDVELWYAQTVVDEGWNVDPKRPRDLTFTAIDAKYPFSYRIFVELEAWEKGIGCIVRLKVITSRPL